MSQSLNFDQPCPHVPGVTAPVWCGECVRAAVLRQTIWTLTVVRGPEKKHSESRLWTWFPTKEAAIISLHNDTEFYCEIGYYDYCVIEEVVSHSMGPHEQTWFKVEWLEDAPKPPYGNHCYRITPMDAAPEHLNFIANWGIG